MIESKCFVSIYRNYNSKSSNEIFEIETVIQQIKAGKYSLIVKKCRERLIKGDQKAYNTAKLKLPAFTPSGTFKSRRLANRLDKYSSIIILDIDKLSSVEDANKIRDEAGALPYSRAVFLSPSELGVKILVFVNSNEHEHKAAFGVLKKWYEKELNIQIDPSGSDVTRLCFFSYDPAIVFNPNSVLFDYLQFKDKFIEEKNIKMTMNQSDLFAYAIRFSENIKKFETGNRNSFVLLLAGNLNRFGMPIGDALQMIVSKYESDGFEESEIIATVKSAYRNTAEFGCVLPKTDGLLKRTKKIDKDELTTVFSEHGIVIGTISDELIIEFLLLSSVNMEYESLCRYCIGGLNEFILLFTDEAHKQIILDVSMNLQTDNDYWLSHNSELVRDLSKDVLRKELYEREEVYRIKICHHRISLVDRLLKRKVIESRFITLNKFDDYSRELSRFKSLKDFWHAEMLALVMHLHMNRL